MKNFSLLLFLSLSVLGFSMPLRENLNETIDSKKALIVIDMQKDFMPGGVLEVKDADAIIPIINSLSEKFDHVFLVRDWHPENHVSFASTHGKQVGQVVLLENGKQVLWPEHCIQKTEGAEFPETLHCAHVEGIFSKGIDPNSESYSAFFDVSLHPTGLGDYLKTENISDLYFVGVATDFCVLSSVLDACDLGFEATLILDACRPINLKPGDEAKAVEEMQKKGSKIVNSVDIKK
jgi:nicotinamidase/pyrazinamidase